MIKNTKYTFDYFQPEEYRFSLDSVFLAQKVAKKYALHPALSKLHILDLCAGCGVIGLELSIHLETLEHIDFIDVQALYQEYFQKNLTGIWGDQKSYPFIVENYANLKLKTEFSEKYDLIVSNPPYFFKGEGLLSPSEFKNRCRFFLDSNYPELLESVLYCLKKNGEAFILVRPGNHHGRDLCEEALLLIGDRASVEIFDEVRGTNILHILKK